MRRISTDEYRLYTAQFVATVCPGSVPVRVRITMTDGSFEQFTIPADSLRSAIGLEEEPFVTSPLQDRILEALKGKIMRVDALATACKLSERSSLYRPDRQGDLNELIERGLVKKHKRGMYNPAFRPKDMTDEDDENSEEVG